MPQSRSTVVLRSGRQAMFAVLVVAVFLAGSGWRYLNSLPEPAEREVDASSLICDASVQDGECDRNNSVAQLAGTETRTVVNLDEVSPNMIRALLAGEDRSFFEHSGVDTRGLFRAAYQTLRGNSQQGGSTLTQQWIRSSRLTPEVSLSRKLQETVLALRLERRISKDEILEKYLNLVPFGRNAYGVEAAAQAYFGHPAATLTNAESAYLVGLIRAPAAGSNNDELARRRRDSVIDAMLLERYITKQEAAEIKAQAPAVQDSVTKSNLGRIPERLKASGYDFVMEQARLEAEKRFGEAETGNLLKGGFRIYTTVDPKIQEAAYRSIYSRLDDPAGDPDGALVTLDSSGAIKAMVGGRDFEDSESNLALGRAAGGTGRQVGSTFKPIVLTEYVQQGNSIESMFDSPFSLTFSGANEDNSDWIVSNFDDDDFGRINLREATMRSVNTVYAQLMMALEPSRVVDLAQKMGITTELDPVPSLVLGSGEASLLDMTTVFSTLMNDGVRKDPYLIRRVEDADGNVIFDINEQPTPSVAVVDPEVAKTVKYAMSRVASENGTGTNAGLTQTKIAGKTGTAQEFRNAWFIGFTCQYVTGVWMGYPLGDRPMVNIAGVENVTGGSLPAQAFRETMVTFADNDPSCAFPATDFGKTVNQGLDLPRTTTTTTTPGGTNAAEPDGDPETSDSSSTRSGTTTTTAASRGSGQRATTTSARASAADTG